MKIIMSIISLILIIVKFARSMKVMDEITVNQYCPNKNRCVPPSSHLICLHKYDPKKGGPECSNLKRYTFTPAHVTEVLRRCNAMRAEIATGTATGRNNEILPRGYGIIHMKWDSELAALAQYYGDRCKFHLQYACAATGKFRRPIESVITLNEIPDLNRIISDTFNVFKDHKRFTSSENIQRCFGLNVHESKFYTQVIQSGATHIGCAFSTWEKTEKEKVHIKNQITCYYSYWTSRGKPVYNTTPPIPGSGYSAKCGCPRGYKESGDCLCEESWPETTSTTEANYEPQYRNKRLRGPTSTASIFLQVENPQPTFQPISSIATKSCKRKVILLPVILVRRANHTVIPYDNGFSKMSFEPRAKSLNEIKKIEKKHEEMSQLNDFNNLLGIVKQKGERSNKNMEFFDAGAEENDTENDFIEVI